uniref:Uncharacterized protein n=1 Tax=Octopus bimaculoides TaxID=37653 RepID=A0A0L8GRQ2_OCTBM
MKKKKEAKKKLRKKHKCFVAKIKYFGKLHPPQSKKKKKENLIPSYCIIFHKLGSFQIFCLDRKVGIKTTSLEQKILAAKKNSLKVLILH